MNIDPIFDDELTRILENNELIGWMEPEDEMWFIHARDAVLLQKECERWNFKYPTDIDALYDFIVVNWVCL